MTPPVETTVPDSLREVLSRLPRGMGAAQVARLLGVSRLDAYRWCGRLGYALRGGGGRKVDPDAWASLDWSRPDGRIAAVLGVCRERVRQVRAELGKPLAAPAQSRAGRLRAYAERNRGRLHGLPATEVLRLAGVGLSEEYAGQVLRSAGVRPPARPGRPSCWRGADWRLPNADLAMVWGVAAAVVATFRSRLGVGSAKWRGNDRQRREDPEYRRALAAEKRRAKKMGRN